ncbi:VPS4-associated protein 1 [Cubamyces lactineus]|nr:VPS4-associated protein 1 [Cubamyces lactineus]
MSFTNLYYKRAVGTSKPCYVCYKPTTTVLATINTVDFIYTCDTHLSDPGFASQVGTSSDGVGAGGAKKLGLSPEEIAKVKQEWEERQKKKTEKAKEKEKEKDKAKDGKDSRGAEEKEKGSSKETDKKVPGSLSPATPPTPPTPSHQRYTLHRDIFALRLAEHRRRRQAVQAKELVPRLPGAPATPLPSNPPS